MKKYQFTAWIGLIAFLILGTACVSSRVVENTRVPEITVDAHGAITFGDERVELKRLVKEVRAAGITREQEINILVPENFDRSLRGKIYAEMLRGGYTRTIFVSQRKASSFVTQGNR
jgi:biopolymer transport protein ExbD